MASANTINLSCRSEPFAHSQWVKDFLPFDPIKQSTYAEFVKSEQLYDMVGSFIVHQSKNGQSYTFDPKKNQSKATRVLENLARVAKMQSMTKTMSDDEKKEVEAQMEKRQRASMEKVEVSLGLGLHQFCFENTPFYAIHQVIGDPVGGYCSNPMIFKSLVIFVEGRGKLDVLKKFVNFVLKQEEAQKDNLFFKIYRYDVARSYWRQSGKKIARDLETIILPTKTWTTLINDFERFLDEKSIRWYFKHGIPYKRSYLFYGVPGSGKSSLIQALAAKYERNLAFLQPSHPKMTDESFKNCIQSAPGNSLIVLEDIDALFNKDRSKKDLNCPLTFSGLLNGLDGVGNPDGQIFIMTTNYVDRLDSALIRSGRVDLHVEFPLATDEQLSKMFLLFYPDSKEMAQLFCTRVRESFADGISMAAVQQHFIQNMFVEPKVVIERVKDLGDRLDVVSQFDKSKAKAVEEEDTKEKEEEVEEDSE